LREERVPPPEEVVPLREARVPPPEEVVPLRRGVHASA